MKQKHFEEKLKQRIRDRGGVDENDEVPTTIVTLGGTSEQSENNSSGDQEDIEDDELSEDNELSLEERAMAMLDDRIH